MYLFRRRRILDQFEHVVSVHHLPRRRGDVFTQLERGFIRKPHQQFAVVRLDVADKVFQPVDKALTVGFRRAFQRIRVRCQKIGRRHQINNLTREILEPGLFQRLHPFGIFDGLTDRLRIQHVLLFYIVEVGVCFPQRVGKPWVVRRFVFGRGQ